MAVLAAMAGLAYAVIANQPRKSHPADSAPGRTARDRTFGRYVVSGKTVTINRPRSELYAFWRDFSNLAAFMENVVSVTPTEQNRALWTIKGPMGSTVELESEIVEEREGELIAWRSVEGSQIEAEGKVTFRDAPGDRGTLVTAIVAYHPPGGALGNWVAKAFQREPEVQGRRELKRFKMLMETGEIADSAAHRDHEKEN